MEVDRCRLCLRQKKLHAGHVIPKFAVNWIKETAATGYLRGVTNPDRRMQDVAKARLLCHDCEQRFSKDEKKFAESVFYPFVNEQQIYFQYDEWLRRFAVSLAWRIVVASPPLATMEERHFQEPLDIAARSWGHYLLGLAKSPGPYTHHMFLAGYVEQGIPNVPRGLQSYLTRSVDSTVVAGKRTLLTYTKLPSVIFASHILPPAIPGWKRTRILRKGRIGAGLELSDGQFAGFLVERAQITSSLRLSPKQAAKMEADLLKSPEWALASESYRAHLAEERLASLNPFQVGE